MSERKSGRGGTRPGAGRPRVLEDSVSYRVNVERKDLDALDELAAAKDVSTMALVRRAIRQLLRRPGR
jgi:hypothetical protein